MKSGPLTLLWFAAVLSCRSAGSPSAARTQPPPVMLETLSYRVVVADVPAGASELTLSLQLPAALASVELQALSAHCLVGNLLLELPLGAGAAARARAQVALDWNDRRELCVRTAGKPVELDLRLGASGASLDAGELERSLSENTTASVDGRPHATVTTRLTRVR